MFPSTSASLDFSTFAVFFVLYSSLPWNFQMGWFNSDWKIVSFTFSSLCIQMLQNLSFLLENTHFVLIPERYCSWVLSPTSVFFPFSIFYQKINKINKIWHNFKSFLKMQGELGLLPVSCSLWSSKDWIFQNMRDFQNLHYLRASTDPISSGLDSSSATNHPTIWMSLCCFRNADRMYLAWFNNISCPGYHRSGISGYDVKLREHNKWPRC